MDKFTQSGVCAPDEICPGVSWDDHADSVATFKYGPDYTLEQAHEVMKSIDSSYSVDSDA